MKQEIFQNFRGLNRTSDRLNSPPDFCYDILNGYVKKDVKSNQGVIQQRDGIAKFNSVVLNADDYGILVDSGTCDTNTANHLIQAGQNFITTVKVGMAVKNTTDGTYGYVTAVNSNTDLTLATDLCPDGDEAYEIYTLKVRLIFETKWAGLSTDIIIRAGSAWGKFDGTNTFNSILTGRAEDALGQCAMFKDELIMVDGGIPQKMTAGYVVSALSADADMPQDSDAVWVHRDKVWLNSQAAPMTAYFCTTNSANGAASWSGATDAGTIDLSTVLPVGDRIRGFRTYGGADSGMIAIICDKYTVIYVAGANVYTFSLLQYFLTTCLSINSLAYMGNDIVYPSRDNFTSLIASVSNNQLEVKPLSNYIVNLWRELVRLTSTDTDYISGVFSHKLNHYYITFPISGNYQTLVYSADIGNFVGRWTYPYELYSWAERNSGVILAGGDGFVYTMNTGTTDDSTAISFKMAMPALYFGDAVNYKKPVELEALVQASTTLDLNIDYWYGLSTLVSDKTTKTITITSSASLWDVALWDVSYWDTQGNALVKTSDLMGRGKLMFIEFRQSTSGSQVTIFWFRIGYQKEGTN